MSSRLPTLNRLKKSKKFKEFYAHPFFFTVVVFDYNDFDQLKKIFPDALRPGQNTGGVCFEDEYEGYNYIFMGFNGALDMKVLVHECIHAKNKIFSRSGQKLDVRNDEFEAYFVGYLVGEVYRAWVAQYGDANAV